MRESYVEPPSRWKSPNPRRWDHPFPARTQRRKESTKARKHVLKIKLSPLAGHLPPAAAQWLSVLSQIQLTLPWVMDCAAPPRAGCSLGAGVRRTKGCRPYFPVRFVGALLGQRFREEFCRHFYPLQIPAILHAARKDESTKARTICPSGV